MLQILIGRKKLRRECQMNNLFVAIVYVVCIIDIMFLEKYVVQTNAVEKSFGKMFFNRYFFDPLIPRIKN